MSASSRARVRSRYRPTTVPRLRRRADGEGATMRSGDVARSAGMPATRSRRRDPTTGATSPPHSRRAAGRCGRDVRCASAASAPAWPSACRRPRVIDRTRRIAARRRADRLADADARRLHRARRRSRTRRSSAKSRSISTAERVRACLRVVRRAGVAADGRVQPPFRSALRRAEAPHGRRRDRRAGDADHHQPRSGPAAARPTSRPRAGCSAT